MIVSKLNSRLQLLSSVRDTNVEETGTSTGITHGVGNHGVGVDVDQSAMQSSVGNIVFVVGENIVDDNGLRLTHEDRRREIRTP